MTPRVIGSVAELKSLIGQEVAVSEWLTITQERIDAFAAATEDRQWIHVDTQRARDESPYRSTIAHGFLTLSLISQLHGQAVAIHAGQKMIINYGLNRVRFPEAVCAGARIRSRSFLQSVEDQADATQLSWSIQVEIEGRKKPALVAEWIVRLYC
ncbi:MAG: MaoC family dehydratase [Planctomycetes bacterium]|nr:MaoC family dehydratase [Planctomycetota bacterium]